MTFGDFEPDDAFDIAPPDAEQVARQLHLYRTRWDRTVTRWEELPPAHRAVAVALMVELLGWGRRQGLWD